MKQPCVTKLIASLPQELSCFADRTNTGKLYTPFARRINSSADVTGTWENDHQKKEISKQNWNITNQNQRALHHARWGASSDQVRWAAQGCDPLRAKSSIQENRGQEPSDGGGVERAMWGAASLNLSALWGCAHATGRCQEAHAASELWRGCLPLPAPLNPLLPLCHADGREMPLRLRMLWKFSLPAPNLWMQKPHQGQCHCRNGGRVLSVGRKTESSWRNTKARCWVGSVN